MSITRTFLPLPEPFDLRGTLACGAAFGWGRYGRGRLIAYGVPDEDGWFTAPTYGCVLRLRQSRERPAQVDIESSAGRIEYPSMPRPMAPDEFVHWYFRMEENLSDIVRLMSHDEHLADATRRLPGLRLIRVEPVECLLAFLASPQNRIPKIALILNEVSRQYGEPLHTGWGRFYLPPIPARMARARHVKLASCGLRYGKPQARNMIRTFKRISGNPHFFTENAAPKNSYESSWQNVRTTCMGAGPKVSDCVCLFALNHLEAVPVDVHVFNSTVRLYRKNLRGLRAKDADVLTLRDYRRIGDFYRARFGRRAGYAQQYLFTAERLRRRLFAAS